MFLSEEKNWDVLTLRVLVTTIDALGTYQQDNYAMAREGGCRLGKVLACTTSPMSDHKDFKLQYLSDICPLHFEVNFKKIAF